MSKVPSLDYEFAIKAFQRAGFVIVRRRGSHLRLQKHLPSEVLKITVPAHKPIKRSTLAHLLKAARLTVEQFNELL